MTIFTEELRRQSNTVLLGYGLISSNFVGGARRGMGKLLTNQQEKDFSVVYSMIADSKANAWQQVNGILISLYWSIGGYVSDKVKSAGWGKNIVQDLSKFINDNDPSVKGFSARNIWRMKQFYETYAGYPKLSALLTEISWTNHLHIISKTRSLEEKEFYLRKAAKNSLD